MACLCGRAIFAGVSALFIFAATINAENIVYPANAGIINVVKDRGVDNTGTRDVSDTLTSILLKNVGWKVIYFPNGTYKVSKPVSAFICPGNEVVFGPIVQGQSRENTVIRLVDGTWPAALASGSNPEQRRSRVVLNVGECGNRSFQKGLHNIRVNIGKNNAGAVGVRFNTSNNGCMSNVDIISEDGAGMIGLDLGGQEDGPGLVHDVYVKGFAVGVQAEASLSMTMSKITVENQSQCGLNNVWRTYIDGFVSTNTVTAVKNQDDLVLVNAQLNGGSSSATAIQNTGMLFARNITTTGYQRAITSNTPQAAPTGTSITEYSSHGSVGLFYTPGKSLNLEVKNPPYPEWETDTSKWANARVYKGGLGQVQKSDVQAIAAALAAPGKTAVLIPGDRLWALTDTIRVGGAIARVEGTGTSFSGGAIVVEDGAAPVVMLHELKEIPIFVRTSRTVIIESGVSSNVYGDGTGDLFLNDHMAFYFSRNEKQHAWIRQLNLEYESVCGPMNFACCLTDFPTGSIWILGYKSEESLCKSHLSGGFLEVLGMLSYSLNSNHPAGLAIWEIAGGQFSAALTKQIYYGGASAFDYLVDETRNGQQKYLMRAQNPNGDNLALYTGYNPAGPFPSGARKPEIAESKVRCDFAARLLSGGIMQVSAPARIREVSLMDIRGRSTPLAAPAMAGSTGDRAISDLSGLAAGTYLVRIMTDEGSGVERIMVAR
jgi:hypothetical protein